MRNSQWLGDLRLLWVEPQGELVTFDHSLVMQFGQKSVNDAGEIEGDRIGWSCHGASFSKDSIDVARIVPLCLADCGPKRGDPLCPR